MKLLLSGVLLVMLPGYAEAQSRETNPIEAGNVLDDIRSNEPLPDFVASRIPQIDQMIENIRRERAEFLERFDSFVSAENTAALDRFLGRG